MRGYKSVILEGELLASPPEAVASFLKRRASQSKDELRDDPIDEEAEAALRSRSNPLIDLALSRYARFTATVLPMFQGGPPCGAIRLAVLSNVTIGEEIFSRFPVALFGGPEQTVAWLAEAPSEELQALFENPKVNDSFLRDLLERSKPWDAVTDERLATIVAILVRNERMRTPREDDYMDGYEEYSYGAVFNAAWKLAESVEPSERWAMALCWLYDRLQTDAFSIDKPLELAARWLPDSSDAELAKKEEEENAGGWLSNRQGVRKGLARLALKKSSKVLPELLASDDPGLRAAAYSDGRLTPEQLSAAYEKDGELVFNQAMHNLWLWRTAEGRAALEAVAWAVVKHDKHSDMLAANIYNGIRKDMVKKHPDWFRDEEDLKSELESSDEPATKADIAALAERLDQPSSAYGQLADQLKQGLQTLNGRVGWIWWFSLGALVASLKHF